MAFDPLTVEREGGGMELPLYSWQPEVRWRRRRPKSLGARLGDWLYASLAGAHRPAGQNAH